jgi:hypothetical protein
VHFFQLEFARIHLLPRYIIKSPFGRTDARCAGLNASHARQLLGARSSMPVIQCAHAISFATLA